MESMVSLKKNIVANYIGRGWELFSNFIFIPIYFKYLGVEAYALIGIFSLLRSYFELFDLGMTSTLQREMARLSSGVRTGEFAHELFNTFEIGLALIALLFIGLVGLSSDWIAQHCLRSETYPIHQISIVLNLISISVTLRIIEGLYRSVLLGLQHHVWLNITHVVLSTIRSVGAIFVLIFFSTIEAFFIWQAFTACCSAIIFRCCAKYYLPSVQTYRRFALEVLHEVKQYAGGMFLTNLLAFILLYLDKILLSCLLTMKQFGYYTFAASIAGSATLVVPPLADSFSPRFMKYVAAQDHSAILKTYHQGAQLMSVILAPIGCVVILFINTLFTAWGGDFLLKHDNYSVIILLTLGSLLNGFIHIPYHLQLAYGWVSLSLKMNTITTLLIAPLLFIIVPHFGVIGAAYTWLAINASYVIILIHFMHRRLLHTEKWIWYFQDLFLPLLGAILVCGALRILYPGFTNCWAASIWVGGTLILTFVGAILCAPHINRLFFTYLLKLFMLKARFAHSS